MAGSVANRVAILKFIPQIYKAKLVALAPIVVVYLFADFCYFTILHLKIYLLFVSVHIDLNIKMRKPTLAENILAAN